MTSYNGFSVGISSSGKTTEFFKRGNRYVSLRHGSKYSVAMTNSRTTRCDAELFIDDEFMGKFRIGPTRTVKIDRPAHNQKKFTFVEESSFDALKGGLLQGSDSNGIVTVKFYPESDRETMYRNTRSKGFFSGFFGRIFGTNSTVNNTLQSQSNPISNNQNNTNDTSDTTYYSSSGLCNSAQSRGIQSSGMQSFSSGGTVLRGKSNQRFVDVDDISDTDENNITELTLRLICSDTPDYTPAIFKNTPYSTLSSVPMPRPPYQPYQPHPPHPPHPPRPPRIEDTDIYGWNQVEPKTPYRQFNMPR
jgi:hypothetical protein